MNSIVPMSSPENSRPEAKGRRPKAGGLLFSNNPNQRDNPKLSMKVSRSSPENSRPEACYFPITRILDVFKEISKYFDLFCVEKSLAAKI